MGYGYNPIVGKNGVIILKKHLKLSRSKIELFLIVLPVFIKTQSSDLENLPCQGGQLIAQ
jgi:hypothetical protein